MTDSAEFWAALLYSVYSPVGYRLLLLSLVLALLFYLVVFAVNFLVIKNNQPLNRHNAVSLSIQSQQESPLITDDIHLYSLLSEKSLASTPVLHRSILGLLKSRSIIRSPTPDGSDSAFFDHRAFYQTLNNSSHYLRRDSFTI